MLSEEHLSDGGEVFTRLIDCTSKHFQGKEEKTLNRRIHTFRVEEEETFGVLSDRFFVFMNEIQVAPIIDHS